MRKKYKRHKKRPDSLTTAQAYNPFDVTYLMNLTNAYNPFTAPLEVN